MMLLSRMERDLLDFLCCCAEKRIGVTKIHDSRAESLERLRQAQQIHADSFAPFPWALEAWRQRQLNKTAAPPCAEPMGPPVPKAAGSGDAALCSDAGDKHAAGIVEAASPVSRQSNTKEASGTPRKGSSAAGSTAARRISDRASVAEPAPEMLPPSASAHVPGAELAAEIEAFCLFRGVAPSRFGKICFGGRGSLVTELKRRERPSDEIVARVRAAIADPPADLFGRRKRRSNLEGGAEFEKIQRASARRGDAIRKSIHKRAMERIEQGIPANVSGGVQVKIVQEGILRQMEEAARLLDPVERAKTILRRRYAPVVGAEIVGGVAGMFLVGRKIISEPELLAMAERQAA